MSEHRYIQVIYERLRQRLHQMSDEDLRLFWYFPGRVQEGRQAGRRALPGVPEGNDMNTPPGGKVSATR